MDLRSIAGIADQKERASRYGAFVDHAIAEKSASKLMVRSSRTLYFLGIGFHVLILRASLGFFLGLFFYLSERNVPRTPLSG